MLKGGSSLIVSILFSFCAAFSQIGGTNQLRAEIRNELSKAKNDTSRVLIMADLANAYWTNNPDSANKFANRSLTLAEKIQYKRGKVVALNAVALALQLIGDFPKSLQYLSKSLQLSQENDFILERGVANLWIGSAYWFLLDYENSLIAYNKSRRIFESIASKQNVAAWIRLVDICYGQTYVDWNKLDSAYPYLSNYYSSTLNDSFWHPVALYNFGDCLFKCGDRKIAFDYLRSSVAGAALNGDSITVSEACAVLARFFDTTGQTDSVIGYAKRGLEAARAISYEAGMHKSSKWLARVYEQIDAKRALLYRKIFDSVNEDMYGAAKVQQLQKTLADYQRQQQINQQAQAEKENRIKQLLFIGGLIIMLVIALILFANNQQKKKANHLLKHQKKEIETQKEKAEDALSALKIAKGELEMKNRDLEVESALERVRSRTNAMVKSAELREVIQLVFQELIHLGFKIHAAGFLVDFDPVNWNFWVAIPGNPYADKFIIPDFDHPLFNQMREAKTRGIDFFTETYPQQEKNVFMQHFFDHSGNVKITEERLKFILSGSGLATSFVRGNNTMLFVFNYHGIACSQIENTILKRFGNAFEQTYTRFSDLQYAEVQAKEATIEAALEKVRGKAMAMHDSQDLSSTASQVFGELRKLGINPFRCGVALKEENSRRTQIYTSSISRDGSSSLALVGWTMLSNLPVFDLLIEKRAKNEDYFPVLRGEEIKAYYEHLKSELSVGLSMPYIPDWERGVAQYGYFMSISVGWLYAWSEAPYNEAEVKILKRFASVIDLTFRRFRELEQSETNTKEAVRRSSLDRVRAEIASMRNTIDLDRITPLIWNELNILNVSFIRCGVFIMDEKNSVIQTFLSTPEGKSIAVVQVPFDTPGKLADIITNWRNKKLYSDRWVGPDFNELANIFVKEGAFSSKEQYLHSLPEEGFFLNLFPFIQGMLYVGSMQQLEEEETKLIQSLANAFSTAYARYEDFNHLESAKHQIEKTLSELKATQAQLIQSEKMASLGEITAGIAHEIQNPLNFINNFAQVNEEFIEETEDAIRKGQSDEAINILHNLKENQIKINQHGQRADSIVKGMLQHSRNSSGQQEPTDLNALVDEYLRLSYHGWKARDKSVHIQMHKSLDPSIKTVNLVSQDLGRVILNICNNAFYAVSEKSKKQSGDYVPTVEVSTMQVDHKVEITIKDNGNGIPEAALKKIFQPFFTTKPTGQGTGLGLSLAYDIIKAHGGLIEAESEEGIGTEFIIQLPKE
jgi:signal transduction histidine kinase